jgi:hypothetical protein
MADRQVTATKKDDEGDILALCNADESWSPRKKADAIKDIDGKDHRYYVKKGGKEVDIHVVDHPKFGKYLRTGPDGSESNNLDELPDC